MYRPKVRRGSNTDTFWTGVSPFSYIIGENNQSGNTLLLGEIFILLYPDTMKACS